MRLSHISALIFILMFAIGNGDWESLGPCGDHLCALATAPSNDNIIYVAPYNSPYYVHASADGGISWHKMGAIPSFVYSLAGDASNSAVVYAGGWNSVYKSTDSGVNWTRSPVSSDFIYGITVHPTNPNLVFCVGQTGNWVMGFFKSTNGGMDWTSVALDTLGGRAYCISLDPSNANTIYVGGASMLCPKVFRSTDGGINFIDVTNGIPSRGYYCNALAVHPTSCNIVYAVTYLDGIFRSTNAGVSWVHVSSDSFLYTLATTRAAPDLVYAGGEADVYKSTDAGFTWFSTGSTIKGNFMTGLAACQTQSTVVYVVTDSGFSKTTNSGAVWFTSNSGINSVDITDLEISPSAPDNIFIADARQGVHKSSNSGTNWSKTNFQAHCGGARALICHNTNPDILFTLENGST